MYNFIYSGFPIFDLKVILDIESIIGVEFLIKDTKLINSPDKSNCFVSEIVKQLDSYVKDGAFKFDLPLKLSGSEHQKKVYQQMLHIPAGQTLSYKDIAQNIASSPRAVGNSCGHNPIALFVPCHRVIAASGKLGGFMQSVAVANVSIKQWLLNHEGVTIR